jgi:hypothetical protein
VTSEAKPIRGTYGDPFVVSLAAAIAVFVGFAIASYAHLDKVVYAVAHCTQVTDVAAIAVLAGIVAFVLAAIVHRRRKSGGSLAVLLLVAFAELSYCKGYPGFVTFKANQEYPEERRKCVQHNQLSLGKTP